MLCDFTNCYEAGKHYQILKKGTWALQCKGRLLVHVVSAYNPADDTEYVITVYEPDEMRWSENFTERR